MPQTEKPQVQTVDSSQTAGNSVVRLGAGDLLQGRLEVQGEMRVAGKSKASSRQALISLSTPAPMSKLRLRDRTSAFGAR